MFFHSYITLFFFLGSFLALQGQRIFFKSLHQSLQVQRSLLSHNIEGVKIFCQEQKLKTRPICSLKVLIRRAGSWEDICLQKEKTLAHRRQRYYHLKRRCLPFGRFFNWDDLFYF